jgi:hypothetical protein
MKPQLRVLQTFLGWSFLCGMKLRDLHSSTGLDRPAHIQGGHKHG